LYDVNASPHVIDPAHLRDNLETVRTALASRGVDMTRELEELAALESRRRRLLPELEGLKRDQNTAADEVAKAKRQGQDTTKIQEANRQRAGQIKQLEAELNLLDQRRNHGLLVIPNIPHSSVPAGKSANDNTEVRRIGILVRHSASSISNAGRRSPARVLRCSWGRARVWRAR
jgi:seryl-tRNA synthetase